MPIDLKGNACLLFQDILGADGKTVVGSKPVPGGVLTIDCLPIIIQNLVFWLLVFGGTVAVIIVIIAGIKLITSGGDAKQVEGARKTLTFAIIGLVVILFSFAIIRFIGQVTGVECITKFGFSQCLPKCNNKNHDGFCPDGQSCTRIYGDTYSCTRTRQSQSTSESIPETNPAPTEQANECVGKPYGTICGINKNKQCYQDRCIFPDQL